MAADQERADRIRALKQERPDLTWRRIADYVGVTERSATDWQKKGGIDYANAAKLAALFEVDVDYIWRGPNNDDRAPSPFADQDALADRLDAIDERLGRIEQMLSERGVVEAGEIVAGIVEKVERGELRVAPPSSREAASKTAAKPKPQASKTRPA